MARKPVSTVRNVTDSPVAAGESKFRRFVDTVAHQGVGGASPPPLKPVTRDDLPPQAQNILGQVCQPADCLAEQPLCPPDPRITCQLIPADPALKDWVKDWVRIPWRIANALKGDLIMSPGGNNGVISSLLSQLNPPQHYTHMGIMTKDYVEVRHATADDDWLQDHPNGSIPLDGPEPTDGFEPDAMRYGWPGTITQSIENAYRASLDSNFAGAAVEAADNKKSYVIHALSFEPSVVNTQQDDSKPPVWVTLQCLVVSPCPESVEVRNAVHLIAEEVKAIRGHYRFYAYTDASIALDPTYFGPPRLEGMQPDPSNPCGDPVPVGKTIPVVCSTLIWAAVRRLVARGALPDVFLDTPEDRDPNACQNTFQRTPAVDNPGGVYDGLFDYTVKERQDAANALYTYLYNKVKDTANQKIPGIIKTLGGIAIVVSAAIAVLGGPVSVAAVALGVSAEKLGTLIDWLTDLPDDVANQVVNAFAFDWCDTAAKDSDKWKNPGTGRSVSPDNIIRSWSSSLALSKARFIGLYGRNRTAVIRPPQWAITPLQAWAVSAGPSGMEGQVTFRGKPINGAVVKVCCTMAVTARASLFGPAVLKSPSLDGVYQMTPPAGNYLATATYQDPATLVVLSDQKPVALPFQTLTRVNFDLQPPPATNREIVVTGKMDIVSRVAFGHDWWGHPQFEMAHLHLGPYGKPGSPDADMGISGQTSTTEGLSDYGSVRINVTATWQSADNSVNIDWIAAIFDGDDQKVSAVVNGYNIAADATGSWTVDLGTAGAWPDRAHIEFSIANDLQK